MSSVLVGVDSGGTRTNVEIAFEGQFADRQKTVRSYEVSDSLSGSLEPKKYAACLRKILAPLESYYDELQDKQPPIFVFISAAAFTPWVRDDFVRAIREVCPTLLNARIAAVGAANDSVALLLGLGADGIIIAGTGSNVIIRSPDGALYQSGGHEWVACDYGSGFWIGLRAIRRAFRDLDAGIDSVLLQRLRQLYGIKPADDERLIARLRDLSIADSNMKKEIARFAASVCAAAERGDASAQNIVKAEAEELADITAGALRRKYSLAELGAGVDLVQCGSVLANEFYRTSFEAQLEMRLRSSSDQRADLRWRRVTTANEATVNLARSLRDSTDSMIGLDLTFRPAVIRFP